MASHNKLANGEKSQALVTGEDSTYPKAHETTKKSLEFWLVFCMSFLLLASDTCLKPLHSGGVDGPIPKRT